MKLKITDKGLIEILELKDKLVKYIDKIEKEERVDKGATLIDGGN